jgi:eukaryotic-like serine/threonine-protein kinase
MWAASQDVPVAHDPIVFGKYQLLELLAKGGMGEVWKARSHGVEGFEKVLVIKRVLPELSKIPRFVAMFIDEAKIAVTLTHANIVQVFDLGLVDGTYFLAMEYVPGCDLGTALRWTRKVGRRFPQELSVYIVSELAKGLDYAHRRRDAELRPLGVVHRDVSPENVLLSHEGEVKLTDFGIAKSRAGVYAAPDLPPGKFTYLAPEQARQEDVDVGADVFALGAVLFVLLTGRVPVEGETSALMFERAKRGQYLAIDTLVPDLPAELIAIVKRAMAVERRDRHQNAGELYEELIGFLYGSGRRVGALDLSRFLEELSLAAEDTQSHQIGPLSGIEEIFAQQEGSGSAFTTPLEVPHRTSSSLPAPAVGVAPRAEWREVSLLAFEGLARDTGESLAARYGGEPYPGQAPGGQALAVFGLSEADGRDAQAAARCALRMLHLDSGPKQRALVHSGRLLIDAEGRANHEPSLSALREEALRWLARSTPQAALASPSAAKLLRGRFELSPPQQDGLRAIVRELSADEGVGKFVGRRDELRTVGEVFALANRGQLRVVGLRGDAGSGKSRLITETARRLRHAGHDVGMYVATCSLHAQAVPFGAIQELARMVLGIEEMEPEARLREKVERLRQLGLSGPQREAVARLFGLSLHASYAPSPSALEGALTRIAYKLAQDRLTVFAWDGAEMMDAASRAVLGRLLATPLAARVVVLLTYRPTGPGPWADLPTFTEVQLKPLSAEDVARLVRHRLLASEVPEGLVKEIYLKTGGNPLYVEELLAAMREAGALEVEAGVVQVRRVAPGFELARTLRGLISSRVGKLAPPQRSMLQLAVTFGSRFTPELLSRASQQDEAQVRSGLNVLEERGIVRATAPSEYTFAHDLVRDVLYSSLSLDERPALHAAVATAIEASRPAELDAAVDRLAYHHREAGNREKAVSYLVRAGERFEAEHALDAAIDVYGQAIDLLSRGDEAARSHVLMLHARIGELAFRTRATEQVADRLGVALELAESLGRDDYVARFAMLRGRLLNKASRFQEGRMWLERALSVARRRGDRGLERDVALAAAEAHARNGEYTAAIRYVESALELARATDDVVAQVRAYSIAAPAFAVVGDPGRAQGALRQLEALTQNHPDRLVEVELYRVRASVLHEAGDAESALEAARQALTLAREYAFPFEVATCALHLGNFYLRSGDDSKAFTAYKTSYDVATEHGFARLQWLNVCLLGFLDAMRFGSDQGRARMQSALRYAEERGYIWDLIVAKYVLAMVEQKREERDAARGLLREVIELADHHGHSRLADSAEQALRAVEEGQLIKLPR